MALLYLDENVSLHLAPRLTANGHPTRSTQQERRRGSSDAVQLLHASRNDWVLVTINRMHFLNLHIAWLEWTREWGVDRSHPGILIIPPLGRAVSVDRLVMEITGFLNHQPPLANECYEWKPDRNSWTRYSLPLGEP